MWTSPYAPVEVGGTTLHGMVLEAAARFGDRPALVDGPSGATVSYRLLAERVQGVAAGLAERGFGPGDVLALWAPNLPQWAGVALGAMAAGGTVTGASPACTERELAAQLADADASVLVTVPELVPAARSAAAAAGVGEVVVLGEADGATPILDLLAASGAPPAPELDPATAVGLLPYSGGTTGLPKGVLLTHANLVTSVRQVGSGLRVGERDTLLAVPPFSHIMGFLVTLALPLCSGATVVTMPRFDPGRFLELLERHRVTVLVGAPPMLRVLAGHPLAAGADLGSLELVVCGGAPLTADAQRALSARLPGATVGQAWGLTETTVGLSMPDRDAGSVPGTVGRVMPNTELRVVDPGSGRDLAAGQPGELVARGPQVMAGYLHRPEATAAMVDPDGWLRTGDLGLVDGQGNVVIVDRLKELIKVSGYQVAPAELEALLATHPAVADAAVLRRRDPASGEVPVAVVVPRPGAEPDPDELLAWVAERVEPHKRVRAVRFADAIPRTPSGKLLRRALADYDTCPTASGPRMRASSAFSSLPARMATLEK
ncbi:MAG TPA: AMP-binding protein [Actinomycetes bacterium]|nr:AMP-binding protein [Actinomycetes bacterium]